MGWFSRSSKAATGPGDVVGEALEALVDPGAPATPAGPGMSAVQDSGDPFSYPTWLTAFSPWVVCDIIVECLVLLTADLIMAVISHRPILWRKREAVRKATLTLQAAESEAQAGSQSSTSGEAGTDAHAAESIQLLRADLEAKQKDYLAAIQADREKHKDEGPVGKIVRSYAISLPVGLVLGALHNVFYLQKYRKGVTWLFVFPEGVIPRGFFSWLLALRTGRKEPGVVGYFFARRILNRPLRRLASRLFPPFAPAKGPMQVLGEAMTKVMEDAGINAPLTPGGATRVRLGASRRNTPESAPTSMPRPPRIPDGDVSQKNSATADSQPVAQPLVEPPAD